MLSSRNVCNVRTAYLLMHTLCISQMSHLKVFATKQNCLNRHPRALGTIWSKLASYSWHDFFFVLIFLIKQLNKQVYNLISSNCAIKARKTRLCRKKDSQIHRFTDDGSDLHMKKGHHIDPFICAITRIEGINIARHTTTRLVFMLLKAIASNIL